MYSGQEIVKQEECRIILANFFEGLQCISADGRIKFLILSTDTSYDASSLTFMTQHYRVWPVLMVNQGRNSVELRVLPGVTGLYIKTFVEDYEKLFIWPIKDIPRCYEEPDIDPYDNGYPQLISYCKDENNFARVTVAGTLLTNNTITGEEPNEEAILQIDFKPPVPIFNETISIEVQVYNPDTQQMEAKIVQGYVFSTQQPVTTVVFSNFMTFESDLFDCNYSNFLFTTICKNEADDNTEMMLIDDTVQVNTDGTYLILTKGEEVNKFEYSSWNYTKIDDKVVLESMLESIKLVYPYEFEYTLFECQYTPRSSLFPLGIKECEDSWVEIYANDYEPYKINGISFTLLDEDGNDVYKFRKKEVLEDNSYRFKIYFNFATKIKYIKNNTVEDIPIYDNCFEPPEPPGPPEPGPILPEPILPEPILPEPIEPNLYATIYGKIEWDKEVNIKDFVDIYEWLKHHFFVLYINTQGLSFDGQNVYKNGFLILTLDIHYAFKPTDIANVFSVKIKSFENNIMAVVNYYNHVDNVNTQVAWAGEVNLLNFYNKYDYHIFRWPNETVPPLAYKLRCYKYIGREDNNRTIAKRTDNDDPSEQKISYWNACAAGQTALFAAYPSLYCSIEGSCSVSPLMETSEWLYVRDLQVYIELKTPFYQYFLAPTIKVPVYNLYELIDHGINIKYGTEVSGVPMDLFIYKHLFKLPAYKLKGFEVSDVIDNKDILPTDDYDFKVKSAYIAGVIKAKYNWLVGCDWLMAKIVSGKQNNYINPSTGSSFSYSFGAYSLTLTVFKKLDEVNKNCEQAVTDKENVCHISTFYTNKAFLKGVPIYDDPGKGSLQEQYNQFALQFKYFVNSKSEAQGYASYNIPMGDVN